MASVQANRTVPKAKVLQLVAALYPLLQRELFLHLSQDQALAYSSALIDTFVELGLLNEQDDELSLPHSSSTHYNSAWLLSRSMQETFQRYAVVLTILHKRQAINRSQLEKQSRDVAERLSALYGISSPEFFDKNVFSTFTTALKDNHWLNSDDAGNLCVSEESAALKDDVYALVWPEIVQHLETVDV